MNPKAPGCVLVLVLTVVLAALAAFGIVPVRAIVAPLIAAVVLIVAALGLVALYARARRH